MLDDMQASELRKIAALNFENSTGKLYASLIRESGHLLERGIASPGEYVRRLADLVIGAFETVESTFEECFIRQPWLSTTEGPTVDSIELWLRERAEAVVANEEARARGLIESIYAYPSGAPAARCAEQIHQLDGVSELITQRLTNAIAIWAIEARSSVRASGGPHAQETASMPETSLIVFISHSSADERIASKLIELLRAALDLGAEQIRCTSVDGYRLPSGAHTEDQLREELNAAKIFIGVITPNSLASAYVLFELGARWGARLSLVPLLAGIEPSNLRGPLAAVNSIAGKSEPQLHQLVEDLASILRHPVRGVPSYARYISQLAALCSASVGQGVGGAVKQAGLNLVFGGSRLSPISEVELGVWSCDMARFEKRFAIEAGDQAVLARFTNEARGGQANIGGPVRAHLIYRSDGREFQRLSGCWLDEPADAVEFRVDQSHELIIACVDKGQVLTISKRRISAATGDEIRTDTGRISHTTDCTVAVRLTNVDNGDVLFEQEFRLTFAPLALAVA
jgi:hypothetical protein